jgi:hypothetical protein
VEGVFEVLTLSGVCITEAYASTNELSSFQRLTKSTASTVQLSRVHYSLSGVHVAIELDDLRVCPHLPGL